MLVLLNFAPDYCPCCGKPIKLSPDNRGEYFGAHCAMVCRHCGISYGYLSTAGITEAAKKEGSDLTR